MDCNQKLSSVCVTKTLYENFIEEKCECDLLIPDYFAAAEKIIQCSALPVIMKKEIEGDRLVLEGVCKFCVIYQGEEESGIKVLSESVGFSESIIIKDVSDMSWVRVKARVSGVSCRLLNSRKINAKAFVSAALKVKGPDLLEMPDSVDDENAEVLFVKKEVHTILEHVYDTTKIQGEIETHTEIQDVLKTDGTVCIKDIKLMGNKAMVKGVLNLYILFTPEEDPCRVEHTSTAIPFSQLIEFESANEDALMDAISSIQNIRSDVETDTNGKNKIISVAAMLMTEGEVFLNKEHKFLIDAFSNDYPMSLGYEEFAIETMVEQGECIESVQFKLDAEGEEAQIIQLIGSPIVRKVSVQGKTLSLEGVLDVSLFICEGENYRSTDKSFPFTVAKELSDVGEQMRCEVCPCLLGLEHISNGENLEIRADIQCHFSIYTKESVRAIKDVAFDYDHPIEKSSLPAMIVYFGEKGERIWDIARHYSTSVLSIKEINGLDEDVLGSKKLLLISR